MRITLDPVGGIAGDMFVAAVLDAFPELTDSVFDAVSRLGIPETWDVALVEHRDATLRGRRFMVEGPAGEPPPGTRHRAFADVVDHLASSDLPEAVTGHARAIFQILADAEAEVHGVAAEEVTFHEIGGWDSVIDITCAAAIIEALSPAEWDVRPLPLGRGRVRTEHGWIPVPAPAAASLLRGFPCFDDGLDGERVTPTGAAILRYLSSTGAARGTRLPATLERVGTGFGLATFPDISNVLRVLVAGSQAADRADDSVCVIRFEVDDQTPEDLATGLDRIRAREGVLDVLQVPAFGKKGRMVVQVQVLCTPGSVDDVMNACFLETTTLGVRWSHVARARLARRFVEVDLDGTPIPVKLAERPDGRITAKAEMEAVGGAADDHATRASMRRRAEEPSAREASGAGAEPGRAGKGR